MLFNLFCIVHFIYLIDIFFTLMHKQIEMCNDFFFVIVKIHTHTNVASCIVPALSEDSLTDAYLSQNTKPCARWISLY